MGNDTGGQRRLRYKLLLLLGAVTVSLLVGEGIVRIFLKDEVDNALILKRLRAQSVKNFLQAAEDPLIYYELKPEVSLNFCGGLIVTGPEGYRIPSRPRRVPPNAVRVAVIGDSSSFGWGVDYEESYPELFCRRISARTGAAIDLRNYSVPAYNSVQECQVFKTRVVPFKPDLLIVHHDNNDSLPRHVFRVGLHPTYGDNFLHSALIKYVMRKALRDMSLPDFDRGKHEFVGSYAVAGPGFDRHMKALREISDGARSMNLPVVAVLFNADVKAREDYRSAPDYVRLHQRLTHDLGELGWFVLDLYPHYQKYMREHGWQDLKPWWLTTVKPIDRHPNAQGHQFIAGRLVDFVLDQPEVMKVFSRRDRPQKSRDPARPPLPEASQPTTSSTARTGVPMAPRTFSGNAKSRARVKASS